MSELAPEGAVRLFEGPERAWLVDEITWLRLEHEGGWARLEPERGVGLLRQSRPLEWRAIEQLAARLGVLAGSHSWRPSPEDITDLLIRGLRSRAL